MLAVTLTVQQFCPWDQLVQLLIPQMKKLRPRVWKALVSKVKALATSPFDGLPVSWLTLRLDWPIGQKTSGNRLPLGSAIPSWLQNRATVWDWHCADGGWASLLLPPSEPISWAGWPHVKSSAYSAVIGLASIVLVFYSPPYLLPRVLSSSKTQSISTF